ncbi:serine--tRNA ligase [Candidatus Pacearchaeota archaeon CG10_big_fil_rev_8_21_14_0_10_32_14]|nr:MAG: serine--tRNA ligase [Candidatus Pacearchaeota archaeon CG10_big_fil_rev_8_21_14_0_10_32_14]
MIDVKLIRESPEVIKTSLKSRGGDGKEVDEFLKLDKRWRELKYDVDSLRSKRNKLSAQVNEEKKKNKNADVTGLIKESKEIPSQLESKENEMKDIEEKRNLILEEIPNIVDKSVPIGDASKNRVMETHGKGVQNKNGIGHEELLISLDMLEMDKASKVAGARFYYLKKDIVKLNIAIIQFALDFLEKKGFTLVQPPFMLRKDALKAAIPLGAFEEMIYKIEGEDLYLIGTAEHALNALYTNEVIASKDLPLRLAGFSPCFRKEAGSHGKDTKGIFRIHQFEKIEQFVFCKPEDSWKEFENILNNSREILKLLGIPFRFVVLASGDMGRVPSKTIDFEGYFPIQGEYKELGSCSNCTDFQARRGNIRYDEKGEFKFVNTLNNTAIATERMIVCLVENYQKKDGSIEIPKVLQKYMGRKVIKAGLLSLEKKVSREIKETKIERKEVKKK